MSAEFKFGTFAGDETVTFDVKSEEQLKPGEVLHAVYAALREKGYNPINQLVGYLISGDPAYITSYKEARSLIRKACGQLLKGGVNQGGYNARLDFVYRLWNIGNLAIPALLFLGFALAALL